MENMKDVWDTKDSVKMCLLEVLEVEEGHGAEAQFEEILSFPDWLKASTDSRCSLNPKQ